MGYPTGYGYRNYLSLGRHISGIKFLQVIIFWCYSSSTHFLDPFVLPKLGFPFILLDTKESLQHLKTDLSGEFFSSRAEVCTKYMISMMQMTLKSKRSIETEETFHVFPLLRNREFSYVTTKFAFMFLFLHVTSTVCVLTIFAQLIKKCHSFIIGKHIECALCFIVHINNEYIKEHQQQC